MSGSPADRIMEAWVELESALRGALPVCSVAPPTQPSELLAALRINHRIGREEEEEILRLREMRNRVAYSQEEPSEGEAEGFQARVRELKATLAGGTPPETC